MTSKPKPAPNKKTPTKKPRSHRTDPKVDSILKKETQWKRELQALRKIVLATGLNEQLKWGQPCYTTDDDKNVVLIHGFKEYCALLFMKGALIKDEYGILVQQTENVQSGRQIRFTDLREITETADVLTEYIERAIEIEKKGLKVPQKTTAEYKVPEEFQNRLETDAKLKAAFERLTPGRQRGYLLYFAQPKQSKTRESRIDKAIPAIMKGKGLND
jgi:uncharacterized protein YdeI (YjbR/CyaY-like superfamily)